jgi:formylglycine-generating enzyme required for sulfatase activity
VRAILLATLATGLAACNAPAPESAPAETTSATCATAKALANPFVTVPSGQFRMGAGPVYREETADFTLHIDGFRMLAHEVTNAEFARFVDETRYETTAEASARSGGEGAGSAVFRMPAEREEARDTWQLVAGATWRAPEGPGSDIEGRADYPVVHVSLADARAYAAWAGGRLPSEEEWEYAASIGLPDPDDPQSGAYAASGAPVANTWQGIFPVADEAADQFSGRAPAGCFPPSRIGLYDMIGNVWEWTDTPYDEGTNTIKGGSYLCAANFCRRYRPAARQPQEPDFSASHIGFRIVKDAVPAPSGAPQ